MNAGLTLAISELFTSIQGEGPSAGTPSVFVRLQGCSIGCDWCDTKYTWAPSGGQDVSLDAIVRYVSDSRLANVVVTGGEPLEHPGFEPLVHALHAAAVRIEVETAGARAPTRGLPVDQWNVSVKLAHSGVPIERRINPEALQSLVALGAWFKFVVQAESDISEILELQRRFAIPSDRILLMPLGMTTAEQLRAMDAVAGWCLRHGFRLSPRLHTLLWGARRGV